MRSFLIAALLVLLAACEGGGPPAPPGRAHEDFVLTGEFKTSSNTARAITGGMVVERTEVTFENGVVLHTEVLNARRGGDLIAKNGDSFAAAVVGPGTLNVELRRVIEQVLPAGVIGLCGAERPQFIALAYDARATRVTMLVFSGSEAPGPEAAHSRVCARFGYAAPDGARTSEGVVL
ncbi:MAG: hypothetical protein KF779_04710 [Hyphomonadaceae bacterium]|nr:hypothetical protein [Hyphomonadaceae bacterium]